MQISLNSAALLNFVLMLGINGFLITYLFPKFKGFHFTGKFWPQGILYALGLEIVGIVLSLIALAVVFVTMGLALFPLVLFLIFGFWLVNAIFLKVVAHYLPEHLKIDGWKPAILAGLVLMVVGMIFGDSFVTVDINQLNMP